MELVLKDVRQVSSIMAGQRTSTPSSPISKLRITSETLRCRARPRRPIISESYVQGGEARGVPTATKDRATYYQYAVEPYHHGLPFIAVPDANFNRRQ